MFSVVRHTLLVVCTAVVIGTKAQPGNSSLQVTITSDPPDNTLCVNETVSLTCQVSNAAQPTYKWSSTKFNISDHSNSIKVIATDVPVQYYCNVFDASTNESGEAGITIYGKVMPPVLQRTNFEEVIKVKEGDSLNLTVEITSDLPLTGEPTWSRPDEPLSSEAVVRNFVVNKHNYTSLGLSDLSFANDSGNYSLTVKNLCGKSSLTVYIDVTGPKVCPPIDPVPVLLRGCVDGGAIVGNASFFQCSFEADYDEFEDLTEHYWTIQETNGKSIKVDEYSGRDDYSVMVDPDCPLNDDPCCKVTSELTISESSIDLNSALVMCYAGLPIPNHDSITSSAHLFVFVEPSLITPPGNLTIKKHANAKFQCHFRASTIEYVTIIKWFKDEYIITNTTKYQVIQGPDSQKDNVMFSVLNVLGVSKDDEGNYSCHCYYNDTILDEFHIDTPVNTPEGVGVLIFQDEKEPAADSSTIIILSVIGVCIIIVIIIGFTSKMRRSRSQDSNQNTDKSNERTSPVAAEHQSMANGTTSPSDREDLLIEVKIVRAQGTPVTTEYEIDMFDERGGMFHSTNHGVTIVFPSGAIPKGQLVELKFAAMLNAPMKFSNNKILVSAIYWISMNTELQKRIQLYLPHCANIENEAHASSLQFVKFQHPEMRSPETMNTVEGGRFPIGKSYGSIEVNHFCYYSIIQNMDPSKIPHNRYAIAAITKQQLNDWRADICLYPNLPTCSMILKEQYDCGKEWQYRRLLEFSFAQGSDQVRIEIKGNHWEAKADIEILNDEKIQQKDIDFYPYYESDRLKNDLLTKMENKFYPPRFMCVVQPVDSEDFFSRSRTAIVKFYGIVKPDNGELAPHKLVIPKVTTELESSGNLVQRDDSGDDSIGALLDEGKPRELMTQIIPIASKWFQLGWALKIPYEELIKLYNKYQNKPEKGLIRVYCHWLKAVQVDNVPSTSEAKLIEALMEIKEYDLAVKIKRNLNPQQLSNPNEEGDSDDPEKESVMIQMSTQLKLLNVMELVPVLNKHQLLTYHENCQLLNDQVSCIERATNLVYIILPTKGPEAYGKFIKCIHEETKHEGHRELARLLPLKP